MSAARPKRKGRDAHWSERWLERESTPRARSRAPEEGGWRPAAEDLRYLAWSRDLAVGIFSVLPLWLLYEVLRNSLAPEERNGAEAMVGDALLLLGPGAPDALRAIFGVLVIASAVSLLRRQVPWVRIALVGTLEGVVYGLLLGPLTQMLTLQLLEQGALAAASVPVSPTLAADLVGSLGAGIFEETVFRLGLLTVLAFLFGRLCANFSMPPLIGVLVAVVVSGLAFSWFHHVGPGGERFVIETFLFRAVAGVLLGLLFVARGFGVCVYTHAAYDVFFYLTRADLGGGGV